jgi:hypothetical protein
VERVAVGETVNRADVAALRFDGQHRARVIRSSVDNYRAGAARAAIADALLPGDIEPRAHCVEQGDARLDPQLMPPPVNRQRDRNIAGTKRLRTLTG